MKISRWLISAMVCWTISISLLAGYSWGGTMLINVEELTEVEKIQLSEAAKIVSDAEGIMNEIELRNLDVWQHNKQIGMIMANGEIKILMSIADMELLLTDTKTEHLHRVFIYLLLEIAKLRVHHTHMTPFLEEIRTDSNGAVVCTQTKDENPEEQGKGWNEKENQTGF